MANRYLLMCMTIIMVVSSVLISTNVSANQNLREQIQDVKKEQNNLKNQKSNVTNDMRSIESEIALLNLEKDDLIAEIKRLDVAVAETKEKARQKKAEIKITEEEVSNLEKEIAELQDRIKERDAILKDRVRSVQENGGVVNYLDVLLGAKDFGDFLDRVSAVSLIVNQDKEVLRKHIEEKELVEEKKNELSDKLIGLENQAKELEKLEAEYTRQIEKKDIVLEELKKKEKNLQEEVFELEEQKEIIAKQEAMAKKLLKQLEEEYKRQQQGNKPATSLNFIRPTEGPVTSNFGKRWGRLHAGIDIGKHNRGADVPIKAAASGIVFRSYYSNSYGNVVFITHNVNGKVFTTLYAHMENRKVSEGEEVKQGQLLGYMGSTGNSTGPHLHFEIHEGMWDSQKNAVDPRKYVNF